MIKKSMGKKPTLHFVYANWCGYCQRFKPEYLKFKKEHNNIFNFKEWDASDQNGVGKAKAEKALGVEIRGFPTLLIQDETGKVHPYRGDDRSPGTLMTEICKVSKTKIPQCSVR